MAASSANTVWGQVFEALGFIGLLVGLEQLLVKEWWRGGVLLALGPLFYFLGLKWTEITQRFGPTTLIVEPDWKWSQQQIWTDYKHYDDDGKPTAVGYRLDTVLCTRFANSDTEPHVVKGVRVELLRKGRFSRRHKRGDSYLAITDIKQGMQRIELNKGVTIPAKGLSEYFMFQLFTKLPSGVSALDDKHTARFYFDVMGRPELAFDMPVSIPKPFETFGWLDEHAKEEIAAYKRQISDEAIRPVDETKPHATVWTECNEQAAFVSVRNDGAIGSFYATIRVRGLVSGLSGDEFARWTHTSAIKITIPRGVTFRANLAELEWNGPMARWKLFGTTEHGPVDARASYASCATSTPIARAADLIVYGDVIAEPDLPGGPVPYRIVLSAFGCKDLEDDATQP